MNIRSICVLCILLFVCSQSNRASGESESVSLNPKNVDSQPHRISISMEDWGEAMKKCYVVIRVKDKTVPLEVASGYLTIQNGNETLCGCQVKPVDNLGGVVFEFVVSPKYLERSTFHFTVATVTKEQRKKLQETGEGWVDYGFTLKDFDK